MEGSVRKERVMEWKSILGLLLVVKGLIPKEEKFDSFPPVGSGEPSKVMLYLLGLQFHYLRSCLCVFFL